MEIVYVFPKALQDKYNMYLHDNCRVCFPYPFTTFLDDSRVYTAQQR